MNEKQIFKMGADAYTKGKTQINNPFSETQQPKEHAAWCIGFSEEYAYWENQLSINVHGS